MESNKELRIYKLIEKLQEVDKDEYYKRDEKEVKAVIQDTFDELIKFGDGAVDKLNNLLKYEYTWSCYFAIKILRKIKSEKSIPHLINLLRRGSDEDYSNEESLYTLEDFGEKAIEPLIKAIKEEFQNKRYLIYLVGTLGEIKHPDVYQFLKEILEDYLAHEEKYEKWFYVDIFCSEFYHQENKEIIPLLKEVEKRIGENLDIKDTIKYLEDPKGHEEELEKSSKEFAKSSKIAFQSNIKDLLKKDEESVIVRNKDLYDKYKSFLFLIDLELESYAEEHGIENMRKIRDNLKNNLFRNFDKEPEKSIINNLKLDLVRTKISRQELLYLIDAAFRPFLLEDKSFDDDLIDFDESGIIVHKDGSRSIDFAFHKEKLERIKINDLVDEDTREIVINNNNIEDYENFLFSIDNTIYNYYKENPHTKDMELITRLKKIRNNLERDYNGETELEKRIVYVIKTVLVIQKYSLNEVKACLSKIIRSARDHRRDAGSRGYLNFIHEFFENPEELEKKYEDMKNYEAM